MVHFSRNSQNSNYILVSGLIIDEANLTVTTTGYVFLNEVTFYLFSFEQFLRNWANKAGQYFYYHSWIMVANSSIMLQNSKCLLAACWQLRLIHCKDEGIFHLLVISHRRGERSSEKTDGKLKKHIYKIARRFEMVFINCWKL